MSLSLLAGRFVRAIERQRKAAMLGVALDAEDGHTRITKGDNFLLYGGSQETHGVMRETIEKINERLDERGQRLEDVSHRDLRNIVHEVWQQVRGSN
jgi:hypothetical protein